MAGLPKLRVGVRTFWRVYRVTESGLLQEPGHGTTEFLSPELFEKYLESAPAEFGNDYPNGECVLLPVFSRIVTEDR